MDEYALIHQNRYKYILKQIEKLGLPKAIKILDVGCFPLDLFKTLEDRGYNMFGISSEHEKVRHKNVVALNIETDKLPFEKDFFDLVLFSEVMEHMIGSPTVYLDKFWKVLKPNGYLLITTPNAVHIKHRLELLFGKSQNFPLFQFEGSVYHRHNREFTMAELVRVLDNFKLVNTERFNAYSPFREKLHPEPIHVKLAKGLVYLPTLIFPTLRDSLFILAQKC